MQVRKRRIYDVTNVLEGIGLFHKTAKNKVGWKACGNIHDLKLFEKIEEEEEESQKDFAPFDLDDAAFFQDPSTIQYLMEHGMS